jgi:hypothetical protein
MPSTSDESKRDGAPLDLSDVLHIQIKDGASLPFEVVGILEDSHERISYAVLMHEAADGAENAFIVTDLQGNLLNDDRVAQQVLDDFLAFAEESKDERGTPNGESH